MKVQRILFILLFALSVQGINAQNGLVIGYNVGTFTQAQRVPQAYAQAFNANSGDQLIQKMKFTGFYRGITLGFKLSNETWLFGMRWSTKKAVGGKGENTQVTERYRIRQNTINVEYGLGGESVKFGVGFDFGSLKFQHKFTDKSKSESKGWDGYYDGGVLFKSGTAIAAMTLFIDIQLGPKLEFRPYYQLPLSQPEILDDRTNKYYVYRNHNFGFSLGLVLFGDD